MMTRILITTFVLAMFGVRAVHAGQFLVQTKATLDPTLDVPGRIVSQCRPLESKIGEYALKYVRKWLPEAQSVVSSAATEDSRILELSIRGIVAPRGARWSGRKAVAIRAVVVANGAPLTSTVIVSSGSGGAFDNTCGALDDVVDDLAERAARWFAKGSKNDFVPIRKPPGLPIAVLAPAQFDPDAGVSNAVLSECALDMALANRTLASLNTRYPDTIPVTDPGQAVDRRLITLTIVNVEAQPGGSLAGTKTLGLRVKVIQDGKEAAHYDIEHTSGGNGIFGQTTISACAALERESAVLAQMVTKWMVTNDRAPLSGEQSVVQPDGDATASGDVASPE